MEAFSVHRWEQPGLITPAPGSVTACYVIARSPATLAGSERARAKQAWATWKQPHTCSAAQTASKISQPTWHASHARPPLTHHAGGRRRVRTSNLPTFQSRPGVGNFLGGENVRHTPPRRHSSTRLANMFHCLHHRERPWLEAGFRGATHVASESVRLGVCGGWESRDSRLCVAGGCQAWKCRVGSQSCVVWLQRLSAFSQQ